MEPSILRQQLTWAVQHIYECEHRIARLHEFVSCLQQSGKDATSVLNQLQAEERWLAILELDKARLRATLEYFLYHGEK